MTSEGEPMSTLREIEKAIETLPLPDRLRLYRDMPQLIGRDVENLDWQRLALENFFQDDSPEDQAYDQVGHLHSKDAHALALAWEHMTDTIVTELRKRA
jgi:hypothetical protein